MVGAKKSTRRVNEVVILKFTGMLNTKPIALGWKQRQRIDCAISLHLSANWIISDSQ